MTRKTRQQVREALGTALSSALTGEGNPLQAFYDYPKSDWGGVSPIGCLLSAGTEIPPMTSQGSRATYHFELYIAVKRLGDDATHMDTLDSCDEAVTVYVAANRRTSDWQFLGRSGQSEVHDVDDAQGAPWWLEVIPLQAESY